MCAHLIDMIICFGKPLRFLITMGAICRTKTQRNIFESTEEFIILHTLSPQRLSPQLELRISLQFPVLKCLGTLKNTDHTWNDDDGNAPHKDRQTMLEFSWHRYSLFQARQQTDGELRLKGGSKVPRPACGSRGSRKAFRRSEFMFWLCHSLMLWFQTR